MSQSADDMLKRLKGGAIDGDTFVAEDGSRIRLQGADTPERAKVINGEVFAGEPGSETATSILQRMLDQGVQVEKTGDTTYNREVAEVTDAQGRNVSDYLTSVGAAEPTRFSDQTQRASERQLLMREAGIGNQLDDPQALADVDAMRKEYLGESATQLERQGKGYTDLDGTFDNSVQRGTDNMQASFYAVTNAVGELTGVDTVEQWGLEGAKRNLMEAALNPAEIESFDDVDSLAEFGTYVIEALGEQVPNLAGMATGAGTGAAIARAAIGKAVLKKFGAKQTARLTAKSEAAGGLGKGGIDKLAAQKAAKSFEQYLAKGQRTGSLAGAGVPSYGLGAGEVQNELKEGGITAPGTALLAGIPIAGLDVAGFDRMIGGLFKDMAVENVKDLAGEVVKGVFKGTLTEMPTEAAQEILTLTARSIHDPTFDVFSEENIKRIREAAIKGGIVGGTVAGGASSIGATQSYFDNLDVNNPETDPNATTDPIADDSVAVHGPDISPEQLELRTWFEQPENKTAGIPTAKKTAKLTAADADAVRGDMMAQGIDPGTVYTADMVHERQKTSLKDLSLEAIQGQIDTKNKKLADLRGSIIAMRKHIKNNPGVETKVGKFTYQQMIEHYKNLGSIIKQEVIDLEARLPKPEAVPTAPESGETLQAGIDAVGRGGRLAVFSETGFEGLDTKGYVEVPAANGGTYLTPKKNQLKIKQLDREGKQHEILGYPSGKPASAEGVQVVQAVDGQGRTVQDVVAGPEELPATTQQAQVAAGPGGQVAIKTPEQTLAERQQKVDEEADAEPIVSETVADRAAEYRKDNSLEVTQPDIQAATLSATKRAALSPERFALGAKGEENAFYPVGEAEDIGLAVRGLVKPEDVELTADQKRGVKEANRIVAELIELFGLSSPIEVRVNVRSQSISGAANLQLGVIALSRKALVAIGKADSKQSRRNMALSARGYEVLYHEFGHLLEHAFISYATKDEKSAIFKAYREWLIAQVGQSELQTQQNRKAPASIAEFAIRNADKLSKHSPKNLDRVLENAAYELSFQEWLADSVARYITDKQLRGDPAFTSFISKLADAFTKLYAHLIATFSLKNPTAVHPTLADFLDSRIEMAQENRQRIEDELAKPSPDGYIVEELDELADIWEGYNPPDWATRPSRQTEETAVETVDEELINDKDEPRVEIEDEANEFYSDQAAVEGAAANETIERPGYSYIVGKQSTVNILQRVLGDSVTITKLTKKEMQERGLTKGAFFRVRVAARPPAVISGDRYENSPAVIRKLVEAVHYGTVDLRTRIKVADVEAKKEINIPLSLTSLIDLGIEIRKADTPDVFVEVSKRDALLTAFGYLYDIGLVPSEARAKTNKGWKVFKLNKPAGANQSASLGIPLSYPVIMDENGKPAVTWGSLVIKSRQDLNATFERFDFVQRMEERIKDYESGGYKDDNTSLLLGADFEAARNTLAVDGKPLITQGQHAALMTALRQSTYDDRRAVKEALNRVGGAHKTKLDALGYSTVPKAFGNRGKSTDEGIETRETVGKKTPAKKRTTVIDEANGKDLLEESDKDTKIIKRAKQAINNMLSDDAHPDEGKPAQNPSITQRRAKAVVKEAKRTWGVVKVLHEVVLQSADAYLRSLGLTNVADAFHHRPGTKKTQENYFQLVRRFQGHFNKKMESILSALPQKRTRLGFKELNHEDPKYKQLIKDLLSQKTTEQFRAEGNMDGVRVREYFDNLYDFLESKGVKMGKREGYFPLVADISKWRANKDGVIAAIMSAGVDKYRAEHIYDSILENDGISLENLTLDDKLMGPSFSFQNQRTIPPEVYNAVQAYLVDDLQAVMTYYTHAAVKRAASQQKWGLSDAELADPALKQRYTDAGLTVPTKGDKANSDMQLPTAKLRLELAEAYKRGDIDHQQYERVKNKVIEAYFGRLGAASDPRIKRLSSALVLYQNFRVLMFATLTSLVDLGQVLWRSNDFRSLVYNVKSVIKNRKDLMDLAKTIGSVQNDVTDHVLNDQMTNQFLGPSVKKWNERFFRMIGLQQWTNAMRVMAVGFGRDYLVRHANSNSAASKRALSELGVTAQQVKDWMSAGQPHSIDQHTEVLSALDTFVDESVVRPDASVRPVWGSDPNMMVFFHLKSFMWGYHEQILRRVWSEMGHKPHVMKLIPAVSLIAMTMPLAMIGYETRRELSWWFNPPKHSEKDGLEYYMELGERSGYLGVLQLMADAEQAEDWGKISVLSLAGPTVDQLQTFFSRDFGQIAASATPLIGQMPGLRAQF